MKKLELKQGIKSSHRKFKHFYGGYMVLTPDFRVLIDVKFYETPSRIYCCLWIHGDNYGSGSVSIG